MIAVARRAVPDELAELMASLPRRGTLTADDEAAYFARIRAGGEDGRAARDEFAGRNVLLVVSIAKKARRRGSSLEDAVQAGNVGLLRAIEDFDPARGCKFSTYATWHIRQAIGRHGDLDRLVHIPVEYAENRASAGLRSEDCREAAARALAASVIRSGPDGEGSAFDLAVLPGREPGPDDAAAVREDVARLWAWLGRLPPRHRQVLALRFGLDGEPPRTLGEVGAVLGVTRERIRQIEAKALEKLSMIAAWDLHPGPIRGPNREGDDVVNAHRRNGLLESTTLDPDAPGEDVDLADPGPAVPPSTPVASPDEPDAALVRRYAAAHPDLKGGGLSRLIAVETGRKIHHFTVLSLLGRHPGASNGRKAVARRVAPEATGTDPGDPAGPPDLASDPFVAEVVGLFRDRPGPAPATPEPAPQPRAPEKAPVCPPAAPSPPPALSPVRRELAAMAALMDALEGLDAAGAARVLAWAAGRFGVEG